MLYATDNFVIVIYKRKMNLRILDCQLLFKNNVYRFVQIHSIPLNFLYVFNRYS